MRTVASLTALSAAAAALAMATGCSDGPFNAPYTASISADIDTIYVANASTFWYADGIGSALKLHVLVTNPDKASGEPIPLNNVWVDIMGPTAGIYLLPEEAVQTVAYPSAGGNAENARDECVDENGNITNSGDSEWCGWYYDSTSSQYLQLAPTYADAAGYTEDGQAYGPNYIRTGTNNFGRVDLWLFIDALPTSGTPPESSRRRSAGDVVLDSGDTGGTGGSDGTDGESGGENFEMGDALISASIGHDTTTITVTSAQ